VKVVLTVSSVGFGLVLRLTPSADPMLIATEAVAVTERVSVAVIVAVNVPALV
jgi:hypothetical protein